MVFTLTPRAVTRCLVTIVCGLALAHVAGLWSIFVLDHDYLRGLIPQFDLSGERNIPTYYAGAAMLLAAILVAIVAFAKHKAEDRYRGWVFIAAVMLFLSFDELTTVHERVNVPVRNALNTSGVLYFAWVIPYVAFALAVAAACFSTVMSAPRAIRMRVFIAGATYVFGAAGMEMFGAPRWVVNAGVGDLVYAFYSTSEEVLEMVGIVIFIHAMLLYIEQLQVSFAFGAASLADTQVTPIQHHPERIPVPVNRAAARPRRVASGPTGRTRGR